MVGVPESPIGHLSVRTAHTSPRETIEEPQGSFRIPGSQVFQHGAVPRRLHRGPMKVRGPMTSVDVVQPSHRL